MQIDMHMLGSAELRKLNGLSYQLVTTCICSYSHENDDVLVHAAPDSNVFIMNPTPVE